MLSNHFVFQGNDYHIHNSPAYNHLHIQVFRADLRRTLDNLRHILSNLVIQEVIQDNLAILEVIHSSLATLEVIQDNLAFQAVIQDNPAIQAVIHNSQAIQVMEADHTHSNHLVEMYGDLNQECQLQLT